MNNRKLDAIGYVDDQLVEKADQYTGSRKKNLWVKWGAMAACLCLVVAGTITLIQIRKNNTLTGNTVTGDPIQPTEIGDFGLDGSVPSSGAAHTENADEVSEPSSAVSGLDIPAVKLPDTTAGAEFDMIGLVVYKGGIYTQAETYSGPDALKIDGLVGEYLGYATGSINEWSTQDAYAEEFASSVAGEVYEVLGYDTGFRICIRNEFVDENGETGLFIAFLNRLNGITLTTGADLFETRLHIRDRIAEIRWQSHDDWNYATGNIQNADLDPALWQDFLDQIDTGVFVNTWDPQGSNVSIYDTEDQAHIFLTMADGTVIRLRLIAGGYVGYDGLGWYFVQAPGEIFDAVFAACGGSVR